MRAREQRGGVRGNDRPANSRTHTYLAGTGSVTPLHLMYCRLLFGRGVIDPLKSMSADSSCFSG
jgi:hypothetical protein